MKLTIPKIIFIGTLSLMTFGKMCFDYKAYRDKNDSHLTNYVDTNQDGVYDTAFDSYYKIPPKIEREFECYEFDENRVIKRKITANELDILNEFKLNGYLSR